MITEAQYFTNPTSKLVKPHSRGQMTNAGYLLVRVNTLRQEWCEVTGREAPIDPDTGTEISGSRNGTGGGGFRLPDEGAAEHSSHKVLWIQKPTGWAIDPDNAQAAVDCFDPDNAFDTWLDGFETPDGGNTKLEEYGLYREHPSKTPGWCHLTSRPPASGRRSFMP